MTHDNLTAAIEQLNEALNRLNAELGAFSDSCKLLAENKAQELSMARIEALKMVQDPNTSEEIRKDLEIWLLESCTHEDCSSGACNYCGKTF